MPWIGALGAVVVGATEAGIGSFLVGGLIVGAAVGGLYSAVSGGDILKGVLYGAVGGAVLGAGGAAAAGLSWGETAAGGLAGSSVSGSSPLSLEGASSGFWGSDYVEAAGAEHSVDGSGILGAGSSKGGSLFTALGLKDMAGYGGVAQLGAAFLSGSQSGKNADTLAQIEREKIASQERITSENNARMLEATGLQVGAQNASTQANKELGFAKLAQDSDQFNKSFTESQWQDRENRKEKKDLIDSNTRNTIGAANYAAGNTQTADIVETNRRRRDLSAPSWYDQNANQANQQQTQNTDVPVPAQQNQTPQPQQQVA